MHQRGGQLERLKRCGSHGVNLDSNATCVVRQVRVSRDILILGKKAGLFSREGYSRGKMGGESGC